MPNLPNIPVYLVEYDNTWPAQFENEKALILGLLPDRRVEIEHIGSTAIRPIASKPIIDIMVLIDSIQDAQLYIKLLAQLEYHYHPYGEDIFPERRWFCKPNPTDRTHHLHLVERETPFHIDHLLFRDFLQSHSEDAARYESLKQALAAQFPLDREGYTDGKSDFVKSILEKARVQLAR